MPLLQSWIESANDPKGEFPRNNLPCGVFSVADEEPRCAVAIEDRVLDIAAMEPDGLIDLPGGPVLDVPFFRMAITSCCAAGRRDRIIGSALGTARAGFCSPCNHRPLG